MTTLSVIPSSPPTHTYVFKDVYACLEEVNTHIQSILPACFGKLAQSLQSAGSELQAHQQVLRVASAVRSDCARFVQQCVDITDIMDIVDATKGWLPLATQEFAYVPTKVGEAFKYTDIPGSNNFYKAEVVAILGDHKMNIKHVTTDKKYGYCTIDMLEIEFIKWQPTRRPKRGIASDTNDTHKRSKLDNGEQPTTMS